MTAQIPESRTDRGETFAGNPRARIPRARNAGAGWPARHRVLAGRRVVPDVPFGHPHQSGVE